MFMILIAVVLGIIWLWAALLYGKAVFKFLRWFIRELIATPVTIRRDARRKRERRAAKQNAQWRRREATECARPSPAETAASAHAASDGCKAGVTGRSASVTIMPSVPPERNEWRR